MISDSLGGYASQMYQKAFSSIIDMIAIEIGLGSVASSSSQAVTGGWPAVLAGAGLYLGVATASLGASKLATQGVYAEGGWVSEHPTGGWIRDGSGVHDDVYLGNTGNVNHWGMGGEFVMNKQASQKYAPLLESLNQSYADGGVVQKDWEPIADSLNLGMMGAFGHGFYKGGPYAALAELAAFAAMSIGGGFTAKAGFQTMGDIGYSRGGRIDVGHGPWDSFTGWVDDRIGSDPWGGMTDTLSSWNDILQSVPILGNLVHDMPWEIIDRLDPQELLDMMMAQWRAPLKEVAQDLVEPGKYYTTGLGSISNIIEAATDWVKYTSGIDIEGLANDLGVSFQNGTDYVPKDGMAYLHQGEAVIPAGENRGGGNVVVLVQGNVFADDLASVISKAFDDGQSRRSGVQYQTVKNDQVGISI